MGTDLRQASWPACFTCSVNSDAELRRGLGGALLTFGGGELLRRELFDQVGDRRAALLREERSRCGRPRWS
ncbi:hypothetical protein [Streptomyces sp. TLI_105]|uniref:hypothetical protein n=1 Tax=Streptomyces sp. TLI_105 TaxID=1881019 RepID=UPI0015A57448|nr:hypothetical protein [Streptomyces sp. TLI_105]